MLNPENETQPGSADVNNTVFNGSIALLAVCLTVISLFQISNKGPIHTADEMLGVSSGIFIISMFLSYLSIRKEHMRKYQKWGDMVFMIGQLSMFASGVFLVMEL